MILTPTKGKPKPTSSAPISTMYASSYVWGKVVLSLVALGQIYFVTTHMYLVPFEDDPGSLHQSRFIEQPQLRKQRSSTESNPFRYDEEPTEAGILSHKDSSYFQVFQQEIDDMDDHARCQRYGFKLKKEGSEEHFRGKHPRRIFFASLIAEEPWEVLEIVSTESYGLYEAIVLSESNRTQNFTPRNYTHYQHQHHEGMIANLFGVPLKNTKIVSYGNETKGKSDMEREHLHRDSILQHWKALGMQPDDIGILSDLDEVFTRDFLRAIQICDVIDLLDYETHQCHPAKMGIRAATQVYEGSPECPTIHRLWYHPSIFSGHCLQGIGNLTKPAPKGAGYNRVKGWSRVNWNESNPYYPYVTGSEFRIEGGNTIEALTEDTDVPKHFGVFTAFHFHNFFASANEIRFKYKTYGHPLTYAFTVALRELHEDIDLMVSCATNTTPNPNNNFKQVPGGFEQLDLFTPIYFKDADYRRRRQAFLKTILEEDHLRRT